MNLQVLLTSQFDSLTFWDLTAYNAVDLQDITVDIGTEEGGKRGTVTFGLNWKVIPSVDWADMSPLNKRLIQFNNLDLAEPTFFSGTVEVVEFVDYNGVSTMAKVTCADDQALLDITAVNLSYSDDNDYHILTNMLGVAFPSYFNIDAAQNTTAIDQFVSQYETASDFVRRLRGRAGTSFYIKPGQKAHYYYTEDLPATMRYDESGTTASNTAAVRPFKVEKYLHDTSGMITRVFVIGDQQSVESITTGTDLTYSLGGGADPVTYTHTQLPFESISQLSGPVTGASGVARSNRIFQYKDTALPENTPIASSKTGVSQMVSIYTGQTINTTITVPGKKFIAYNKAFDSGYELEVQEVTFQQGVEYTIRVAKIYDPVTPWMGVYPLVTGSHSPSDQVKIIIDCPNYYLNAGNDFGGNTIWIGDGWPILVDLARGQIEYMAHDANAINYPGEYGFNEIIRFNYYLLPNAIATYEPNRTAYGGYIGGGNPGGGYRYFDYIVKDTNLKTLPAARARARAELLARANGIKTGTFTTFYGELLEPGMNVRLSSAQYGFDEHFLVNRKQMRFIEPGELEATVQPLVQYSFDFGDYNPELADLLSKLGKNKDDAQAENGISFNDTTNYSTLDKTYFGVSTSIFGTSKFTG